MKDVRKVAELFATATLDSFIEQLETIKKDAEELGVTNLTIEPTALVADDMLTVYGEWPDVK
jgi:hypothetical protein